MEICFTNERWYIDLLSPPWMFGVDVCFKEFIVGNWCFWKWINIIWDNYYFLSLSEFIQNIFDFHHQKHIPISVRGMICCNMCLHGTVLHVRFSPVDNLWWTFMDIVEEFLELGKNAPRTLLVNMIQLKFVPVWITFAFCFPPPLIQGKCGDAHWLAASVTATDTEQTPADLCFALAVRSCVVVLASDRSCMMQLFSFVSLNPEEKFAKSSCDRRRWHTTYYSEILGMVASTTMAQDAAISKAVPWLIFFLTTYRSWYWYSCSQPRIEVVLTDPLRADPNYLGKWHVFLPSEVFPGKNCVLWVKVGVEIIESEKVQYVVWPCRLRANYLYGEKFFRDRWLGPPGATWLQWFNFAETTLWYGPLHAC